MEKKRSELFNEIPVKALSIGVGIVTSKEIDEINILNATFKAMNQAIGELVPQPEHLLIDGIYFAELNIPAEKIIDSDMKSFTMAAASIIEKVIHYQTLLDYISRYSTYGFAKQKGYGTAQHNIDRGIWIV